MTTREVSFSSKIYFSPGRYSLHFLSCWQQLLSLNVDNSPSWWSYAWLPLKTVTPALKETFIRFCYHNGNIGNQMKKKNGTYTVKWEKCSGRFSCWQERLQDSVESAGKADLWGAGWQNIAQNYACIIHVAFILFKTTFYDFRRWWILPGAYIIQSLWKLTWYHALTFETTLVL